MAFIRYVDKDEIPDEHQIEDDDNILRIHGVHPQMLRIHYDMYVELMHRKSKLSRVQREMIAVTVSSINQCHY